MLDAGPRLTLCTPAPEGRCLWDGGALTSTLQIAALLATLAVLALVSITIFFVTSADSASIVMGSMSQRGKPEPSMWVTITWGVLLGATAATLLVAGGETALGGLGGGVLRLGRRPAADRGRVGVRRPGWPRGHRLHLG